MTTEKILQTLTVPVLDVQKRSVHRVIRDAHVSCRTVPINTIVLYTHNVEKKNRVSMHFARVINLRLKHNTIPNNGRKTLLHASPNQRE